MYFPVYIFYFNSIVPFFKLMSSSLFLKKFKPISPSINVVIGNLCEMIWKFWRIKPNALMLFNLKICTLSVLLPVVIRLLSTASAFL